MNNYLLSKTSGRFFLRGIFDSIGRDKHLRIYTDLIGLFEDIIVKSEDILYRMPEIPTPKPITVFKPGTGLNSLKCGLKPTLNKTIATKTGSDKIQGGINAEEYQHPWHATLSQIDDTGEITLPDFCGGTLISSRVVLTAAHCIYYEDKENKNKYVERLSPNLLVTLGMLDATNADAVGMQNKTPNSVVVHPEYDQKLKYYDVALLLFSKDFNITSGYVSPICLWNHTYDFDDIANSKGEVVGFGRFSATEQKQSDILQEATLSIQSYWDCYLQNKRYFSKYLKPGINFCAGDKDKAVVCVGDSGGGFAIERDGIWFLRGVVSHGIASKINDNGTEVPTCNATFSSIYIDLTSCMDWIEQTVLKSQVE